MLGQPWQSQGCWVSVHLHTVGSQEVLVVISGGCSFFPTQPCLLVAHCKVPFMRECFQEHRVLQQVVHCLSDLQQGCAVARVAGGCG